MLVSSFKSHFLRISHTARTSGVSKLDNFFYGLTFGPINICNISLGFQKRPEIYSPKHRDTDQVWLQSRSGFQYGCQMAIFDFCVPSVSQKPFQYGCQMAIFHFCVPQYFKNLLGYWLGLLQVYWYKLDAGQGHFLRRMDIKYNCQVDILDY